MDYSELLGRAREQIENIPDGHIFMAKDLFPGTNWNQLQKGEKLSFGKQFKNFVLDGKFPGVMYIGKAENNSAQYQKRREGQR